MILEIDTTIKSIDLTEQIKNQLVSKFGKGNVYTSFEMRAKYSVLSFDAPFVTVERNFDGVVGTLEFSHTPRFYFNFIAE